MKEYRNPYNTGNRHYGGNISAMGWKAGQTQRAYDLSYDNLSRLTGAKYYETNANGRYSTQYTYDSMGNILTLKRNGLQDGGTYGLVDNLTYTYNGNQLTKISDSVEDPTYVGAFNFRDGADSSAEYTYDAVGNMTSDKNKGITSITYNVINQPQKITFYDGKTTEYVYSYDGTKLQTVHKTLQPQTSATTTYCGNMIYENGVLKQMLIDGGYVTFSGATPVYHFYIQDHLGNNRVVAKANGTVEQINHYYPYGGLMADICTGSDIQPYKYNGKELDRMHGLDTYDYGARQHNAATGRWDRMDQLAEENPEVSPYVYCHNNPINKIDPDGMDDYYSITGQYLSHDDNGTDFIIIRDQFIHELKQTYGMEWLKSDTPISKMTLTAKAYSNIFTDILSKMDGVDVNDLYNGKVSVTVWEQTENIKTSTNNYNESDFYGGRNADIGSYKEKQRLNAYIFPMGTEERNLYNTISNVQNLLGAHEYLGHYKQNLHGEGITHQKVYEYQMKHSSWKRTTNSYKNYMIDLYNIYKNDRK